MTALPRRLPLVSARTAVADIVGLVLAAAGAGAVLYRSASPWEAAASMAFVVFLALIARHDVLTRRAPNRAVYPAVAVAAVAVLAWLGGLAAFSVMLVLGLLARGALGYGDVKVAAVCGLAVGIRGVPLFFFASFLIGGVFALAALLSRRRGRRDAVAFTPFLAAGVVAVMWRSGTYLLG
jgi:leader peptidase (prepilin peptidase)/N-methyltransferase